MLIAARGPLQRLEGLIVADVMSREVAVISDAATMEEAAELLKLHGISGAVVDHDRRCIGVLSAPIFCSSTSRSRRLHDSVPSPVTAWDVGNFLNSGAAVYDGPAAHHLACRPMMEAAELMCIRHVHRLIVLDERETPVGLVSTLGVVSAMVRRRRRTPTTASRRNGGVKE
jgi:CBS-domain-containing membrane protein